MGRANISRFALAILLAVGFLASIPASNASPTRSVVFQTPFGQKPPVVPDPNSTGIEFDPPDVTVVDIPVPPALQDPQPTLPALPPAPSAPAATEQTTTSPAPAPVPAVPAAPVVTPPATTETTPQAPPPPLANTAQTTSINPSPAAPAQPATPSTTTTVPQVVTITAPKTPAVATTTTVAVPPLQPICSNHPEFGQTRPQGWVKNPDGTCTLDVCPYIDGLQTPTTMPKDAYGEPFIIEADGQCMAVYRASNTYWCTANHHFVVIPVDQLDQAKGDTPAIMVEGFGPQCLITDIATWGGKPDQFGKSNVFVDGGGGPDYGPFFNCEYPFGSDQPAPKYVFYAHKGEALPPTYVPERGCPTATPVQNRQTLLSVKMHGLKWGGHYYRDTQVFARVLAREGSTWRGWKNHHPALAAGLIAHSAVARQSKK
jgi:hypothetical protein